jgi:adenylate cyclase
VAAVLQVSAAPSAVDRPLIVGFADRVGFRSMSRALDSPQLARMVGRFEAVAHENILTRGGRVVKIVGDEVMFSVDETVRAAEIALGLVDAHARHDDLPDIRVGVASGPTLAWEGDLFGPTVNLASRLVDFARPATVVVSDEFGTRLQEHGGFELRHLRPVKLKGVGRVRTWVVRRAQ